ncbi:hypothetical protein [Rhodoferax sp. GW822-FHT02A01]|uniref:hypothetical protein n=1 Tax=Rhodoferax sp. GW822-FHT02A01 TaxID=3141537 RepID=UPI00315CB28D
MGLLSAFGFQKEKKFAAELVKQLAKDISADQMQLKRRSMSVNKITRLLEKTYLQVKKYQEENSMGFLRRTVFANTFRWELRSQNYPEDFCAMVTEGLIVELMKKTEGKK